MDEKQLLDRAKILLKATKDILTKCHDSFYVLDVMSVTAIWDEAECDGYCLKEEITELLKEFERQEKIGSK